MSAEAPEWMTTMHARQISQFMDEGFIQESDSGELTLTEKGQRRAAARLDKLPDGDEILLTVAILNHHGVMYRRD